MLLCSSHFLSTSLLFRFHFNLSCCCWCRSFSSCSARHLFHSWSACSACWQHLTYWGVRGRHSTLTGGISINNSTEQWKRSIWMSTWTQTSSPKEWEMMNMVKTWLKWFWPFTPILWLLHGFSCPKEQVLRMVHAICVFFYTACRQKCTENIPILRYQSRQTFLVKARMDRCRRDLPWTMGRMRSFLACDEISSHSFSPYCCFQGDTITKEKNGGWTQPRYKWIMTICSRRHIS